AVRAQIIEQALGLAGVEKSDDGSFIPTQGKPKQPLRIRLAAMRILAGYDRLSVQPRKVDLLENPTGETPVPQEDVLDPREVSSEAARRAAGPQPGPPPPPRFKKKTDAE